MVQLSNTRSNWGRGFWNSRWIPVDLVLLEFPLESDLRFHLFQWDLSSI